MTSTGRLFFSRLLAPVLALCALGCQGPQVSEERPPDKAPAIQLWTDRLPTLQEALQEKSPLEPGEFHARRIRLEGCALAYALFSEDEELRRAVTEWTLKHGGTLEEGPHGVLILRFVENPRVKGVR